MRKLTLLAVPLIAALTAQAAAATEHHYVRTKHRAVTNEQLLNSNAYAAPGDFPMQSRWSEEANGAMASGLAGR